jgi:hypothetical protein
MRMRDAVRPAIAWLWRGILVTLMAVILVGCTPPYPTQKRTAGPAGLIASPSEPSTITAGKSTRDDVLSAFKGVSADVSSRWFFWGRWETSSFAFSGLTDSGVEEIPFWSATNLFVEFDEKGTVKKRETLSDKRIIPELQRVLAEHPQSLPPTTKSLDIAADLYPSSRRLCAVGLKVSSSVVEFSRREPGICFGTPPSAFSLPTQKVTVEAFTPPFGEFGRGPVAWIRITLRFSQGTPVGTDLPASMKANDLVSLMGFLEAARRAE